MREKGSRVNLFRYTDYRKFLRDWYKAAKASRGSFSFRAFSKRAGFTSPNFFKLVMDGDRNLAARSLEKFIIGLGLNKQEQEFFRNLVAMNQGRTEKEKALHYKRLLHSRKYSELQPLARERYDYYAAWYHPVIRELVASRNFDGTPGWLTRHIRPKVTPAQVVRSLTLLEKLGFIQKGEDGRWRQTESLVSTGPEVTSLTLRNYHLSMLDLTKEMLEQVPPEERDISALTLGVARGRGVQIKRKIQEFRQEILKLVSLDEEPEEVLQLNIQMFPLTAVETGRVA